MKSKKQLLFQALLFLLLFSSSIAVQAAGISITPRSMNSNDETLANGLKGMFGDTTNSFATFFVDKFLTPEADNLAKTNVVGALMGHPSSDAAIRSGLTPGFMVGSTVGFAGGLSDDVVLSLGERTVAFPLAAGVAGFNLYGGINLGLWGFGLPNWDLVYHTGGGSFSKQFGDYEISGSSFRTGLTARYHIIAPFSLILVRFLGLSASTGYAMQHVDFKLSRTDTQTLFESDITASSMTWTTKQTIGFETTSHVIPLQLQTGVQLLFFLNLHAGVGYALAFGDTEVGYKNEGYVQTSFTSTPAIADVVLDYTGKSSGKNTRYIFGGAELNIFLFHLLVEAMWNFDKSVGLSFGLRFQW